MPFESSSRPSTWLLLFVYCVSVSKIAHRGSDTSASQQLLAAINAEVTMICVGTDNPLGHLSTEILERLTERLGEEDVYRTDQNGIIEFIANGETLRAKTGS
jgi:beta-lactamase superfamily II metal-dependent hydrolase